MSKKKSKAEKKKEREAKRKAEAEALRLQQEEERKRQEELERQRQEEIRKKKELKERLQKEEKQRLEKENEEDKEPNKIYLKRLKELKIDEFGQKQWIKHLKCSDLPDLTIEKNLNDFLNTWNVCENNKFIIDINNVEKCINDIEYCYKLLYMLKNLVFDNIQNGNKKTQNESVDKLNNILKMAEKKLKYLINKCIHYFTYNYNTTKMIQVNNQHISFAFIFCENKIKDKDKDNEVNNIVFNLDKIGIKLDFPPFIIKQLNNKPFCIHVVKHKNFYKYENTNNELTYYGSVLDINIHLLPNKPKIVNGWRILNITNVLNKSTSFAFSTKDDTIESKTDIGNPESDNENDDDAKKDNDAMLDSLVDEKEKEKIEKAKIEAARVKKRKESKYIQINTKLDDTIYINDIQLGCFNKDKNIWETTCFNNNELVFNENKKEIKFEINKLSMIALVQPKGLYYKYQTWKLTPASFGVEKTYLKLINHQSFNIEIEIASMQCRLIEPDLNEFKHFSKKFMKPNELIRCLKDCGINLCYKFSKENNINNILLNKNEDIVNKGHMHMSIIASLFEIKMSKFNNNENENNVIFNIRKFYNNKEENEDNSDSNKEKWMMICCNDKKFYIMQCNENDEKINYGMSDVDLAHTTLLRCVRPYCNNDFMEDLQSTSFKFIETVKRMLNLVNVLRV